MISESWKLQCPQVPVFFLHANIDLRNPVDSDAPDRDCVHTVGPPKPLPPQVRMRGYRAPWGHR